MVWIILAKWDTNNRSNSLSRKINYFAKLKNKLSNVGQLSLNFNLTVKVYCNLLKSVLHTLAKGNCLCGNDPFWAYMCKQWIMELNSLFGFSLKAIAVDSFLSDLFWVSSATSFWAHSYMRVSRSHKIWWSRRKQYQVLQIISIEYCSS